MTIRYIKDALMRLWASVWIGFYAWITRRKITVEVVDVYDQGDKSGFSMIYRLAVLYPHFKLVDDLLRTIPSYSELEECTLHVILEGMEIAKKAATKQHLPKTAAFLRFGNQTVPFFTTDGE